MQIIISPAKTMVEDTDSLAPLSTPVFLDKADTLLKELLKLDKKQLQVLYKCSEKIVDENFERLKRINLNKALTPALFAYQGIQYQYMGAKVLEDGDYAYLQDNLSILSGFYGVLRPFDGVRAYRLEMGAKFKNVPFKDLYAYWRSDITSFLKAKDLRIVNLASLEYSKAIDLSQFEVVHVYFGHKKGDKIVEKGTVCKQARGAMVKFLANKQAQNFAVIKDFNELGFSYADELSDDQHYYFVKEV